MLRSFRLSRILPNVAVIMDAVPSHPFPLYVQFIPKNRRILSQLQAFLVW